ncbi:dihydropteroate synthase [Salinisphaera sp. SWV1]|uniref:dihydropteroate synthase n=1 Tax=Salinisphaera sp. SWV1 TaxID=3454139 RepID=UPI003F84D9E7
MNTNGNQTPAAVLAGANRSVSLAEPAVMGVLNVTPDSFSDGGRYVTVESAVRHALAMIGEGAAIIDIGGESTRPGAAPVSPAAECDRVLPVVEALRAESDVFISMDTSSPEVIRAACAAGADMINDIRGLTRPGALEAAAAADAAVCVMHMQGEPESMQSAPTYTDVVAEVRGFLQERVAACRAAGLAPARIVVDPGFGFGKTLAHNLALLRAVGELHVAGRPVLMGVSRKSMFAQLLECDDMPARINASLGAAFWATLQGVGIIRCHDVRQTAQMVCLARHLKPA